MKTRKYQKHNLCKKYIFKILKCIKNDIKFQSQIMLSLEVSLSIKAIFSMMWYFGLGEIKNGLRKQGITLIEN